MDQVQDLHTGENRNQFTGFSFCQKSKTGFLQLLVFYKPQSIRKFLRIVWISKYLLYVSLNIFCNSFTKLFIYSSKLLKALLFCLSQFCFSLWLLQAGSILDTNSCSGIWLHLWLHLFFLIVYVYRTEYVLLNCRLSQFECQIFLCFPRMSSVYYCLVRLGEYVRELK